MAGKLKRILPTEENPRYGSKFRVLGIQLVDIDGRYTEMKKFEMMEEEDNDIPVYFSVGKSWSDWKRLKEKLSSGICKSLNKSRLEGWQEKKEKARIPSSVGPAPVNFRDVVAFKVKYFGDTETVVL